MKKVLIIDGFGLIFKSYYAFINRPLTNVKGENTSAVFGFFKSLIAILKKENPDYYFVALEGEGECFRNKIYAEYKANRPPAPEDLVSQIPKIINLLEKLNIPHLKKDTYEADDIIGTVSDMFTKDGDKAAIILSSDKDMRQLVNEKVFVYHPLKTSDEFKVMDEKKIIEEMGVSASQVVDYLALTGDSSDNIPGVKGIGPKTASALLSEWQSLENIYASIDKISSKSVKEKLVKDKENAFLSRTLATIKKDIPLEINWQEFILKPLRLNDAIDLLKNDNLKTLIESIEEYNRSHFKQKDVDLFSMVEFNEEKIETPVELSKEEKKYGLVFDKKDLTNKINEIKKAKEFSFDLETTGFNFLSDKIICISFSTGNDTYIVPFNISELQQKEAGIKIDGDYIKSIFILLKEIFEDENILKIGHNLKFDIKFLIKENIYVQGKLFDTMIAEYCIDASHNILNMDDIADKYLSYKTIHYKDLVADTKKGTLQDILLENLLKYSGQDADITFRLYTVLKNKIERDKKTSALFYDIEMPLLKVLIDMEYNGVSINTEYLKKLSGELDRDIIKVLEKIQDIAEEEFNPNSPKQIAEILYNKFKLPVFKKTKTGPSTDVDVLTKLSYLHPIASELLEYRTLSKIKSTYSDSLPLMVNKVSNKIHTTYLQSGTQTGRLASKDPNLQNIPVKTELGLKVRKAFIPTPGNILISADYAQIELFLLAEFSNDENLFSAFKNNEDIHIKTASIIYNKKPEEVTKDERKVGKTINFSILYGQGPHRLSENLGISRKDAANFINLYFTSYSGVRDYMEVIREKCRKTGYVETFWGRKRTIPEIFDQNKMRQANGERMAVNTTIQGTAADLIKLSMIKIQDRFKKENLKSLLIMQVHDELIFDVVKAEKEKVIGIIKECMEKGYDFKLKLQTSLKSGENWGVLN